MYRRLISYPDSAIVARASMVVVVLLSHPVVSYQVPTCVANIWATAVAARHHGSVEATAPCKPATSIDGVGAETSSKPVTTFVTEPQQIIIRGAYLALTTLTALLVTDLGIVVALAGAAAATVAVFIAPGECYRRLHPQSGGRLRVAAGLLSLVGCILLPLLVLLVLAAHGYLGSEWASHNSDAPQEAQAVD